MLDGRLIDHDGQICLPNHDVRVRIPLESVRRARIPVAGDAGGGHMRPDQVLLCRQPEPRQGRRERRVALEQDDALGHVELHQPGGEDRGLYRALDRHELVLPVGQDRVVGVPERGSDGRRRAHECRHREGGERVQVDAVEEDARGGADGLLVNQTGKGDRIPAQPDLQEAREIEAPDQPQLVPRRCVRDHRIEVPVRIGPFHLEDAVGDVVPHRAGKADPLPHP
ncbi:hypothetical protein DFJ74DRAFT_682058 [Hyaloraphidium curvatum]|nr:hypothetical protein DFJ74DRAFT_682058 [Hyaloraphidium curvatum]